MVRRIATWFGSGTTLAAAGLVVGLVPGMAPQPAFAQSTAAQNVAAPAADGRLERIETQLRALQRQVFPGGDQRFFEPEIAAPQGNASPASNSGAASASALTDVLARLEAIELQLAQLTAATEVNQNSLSLLETRLSTIEAGAATIAAATAPAAPAAAGAAPAAATPTPAAATAPVAGPSPQRLAAVQAILKPATTDAGDDEYTYGFRLWEAGFYPEAQQQLALFLERYPTHARVTFGRNLLGRAFLDAGEPRRAATHFFENYQANKQAARAPDSLLFLAESMVQLGDTNRACIALAEFGETYPALVIGRLQTQYEANRSRVSCQ